MVALRELAAALGCSPTEPQVKALIDRVKDGSAAPDSANLGIKAYPDVVYHNYRALGLSLQCE